MTKLEAEKTKPQRKWLEGNTYECILSKSPAYKVGKKYTSFLNKDGQVCLKGDDGFEDICSMLVSGFKVVDTNKKD